MSEKVEIELTVAQVQAVNAWIKNNQQIVQNEEALRKLGEASERASKKSKDGFESAGATLAKMAQQALGAVSAYGALRTAASLYLKELEAIERVNRKALDFQLDVAVSQRNALLALGTGADISPTDFVAKVERESKIPLAKSYAIMDAAISAAGNLGARRGVDTALAAGEFAPHLPAEELKNMATGAIELQKSYPEYNPRQAVAQLFGALEVARQENPAAFAKNVLPAIGQARAYGSGKDDFGFLNAVFAAVGQRAGDAEGAVSRTAVLTMLKQLTVEGRKSGLFAEGASVEEQLAALGGDSDKAVALRKKLLGPLERGYIADQALQKAGREGDPKLKSEAATFIAITELLQPGSQTSQMVDEFRSKSGGTPAEVLARAEGLQGLINAQPGQQAFRTKQILERGMEKFRSDPSRALSSIAREPLSELLVESGASANLTEAGEWIDKAMADGGGPEAQLRRIIQKVQFRAQDLRGQVQGFEPNQIDRPRDWMEREQQADKLDAVIALLQEQLAEMRRPQKVEVEKLPANQAPQPAGAAALNER